MGVEWIDCHGWTRDVDRQVVSVVVRFDFKGWCYRYHVGDLVTPGDYHEKMNFVLFVMEGLVAGGVHPPNLGKFCELWFENGLDDKWKKV